MAAKPLPYMTNNWQTWCSLRNALFTVISEFQRNFKGYTKKSTTNNNIAFSTIVQSSCKPYLSEKYVLNVPDLEKHKKANSKWHKTFHAQQELIKSLGHLKRYYQ